MSPLVLAINYFFHLVATIIWVGGLALLVLVVWPAANKTLSGSPALVDLLVTLRKRFNPIANLSLVVLIVTGLFQMTADPHYDGLLVVDNDWSRAILLKHLAIAAMVVAGGVIQWGIGPAQERLALLRAASRPVPPDEDARLARRERRFGALSLGLGLLVLAFTALATAL